MTEDSRPLVIAAPEPREIDLIFTPDAKKRLFDGYRIVECPADALDRLPDDTLAQARYILGQPPVSDDLLARMTSLRAVLNVEGNFFDNMPYEQLFERGIHVLSVMGVFAVPVAELGLAMAINLARQIVSADHDFARGTEQWGLDGNARARLLTGSRIGFIGFGELGRATNALLAGFNAQVSAYDPWLPQSMLAEQGVTPASLEAVLRDSDFIFVVASVTSDNAGFLAAPQFQMMKKGAALILLSRAAVVNFDDLIEAVRSGHIVAASDVFPDEPPAADHPVRALPNFIRSAHRAGAMDVAFKTMGDWVLEDMALMDAGLPPRRCNRAERETVGRMRSKPVDKS